jgi:hypothetical protein
VPPWLDDLTLACLAKDPLDRPRDVAEIMGRLELFDRGAVWTATDARAWWRQHLPPDAAAARPTDLTQAAPAPQS